MKFPIERIVRYTSDDGVHVKVEEVGDLVRCKDCKHYLELAECYLFGRCMGTDDFCSWGERKEDAEIH